MLTKKCVLNVTLCMFVCVILLILWTKHRSVRVFLPTLQSTTKQQQPYPVFRTISSSNADKTTELRSHQTPDRFQHLSTSSEPCVRRLPKAIIVGVQKCGTSALLHFLNKHPQIEACLVPEEPKFFAFKPYGVFSYKAFMDSLTQESDSPNIVGVDLLMWKRRFDSYMNMMPCSYGNQITIEKDPGYFYREDIARRIKDWNPHIKLLFIVKDPVERSLSAIAMKKSHGKTGNRTVDDLVFATSREGNRSVDDTSQFIKMSDYQLHMRFWLKYFSLEQMLIVDGKTLETAPTEELHKVEQFLDLKPFFTSSMFKFNVTKGKYCFTRGQHDSDCLGDNKGRVHPYISDSTRNVLRKYFAPNNELFFEMVNKTFSWGND